MLFSSRHLTRALASILFFVGVAFPVSWRPASVKPSPQISIERLGKTRVVDFRTAPNVTEFRLPTVNSGPYDIAAGPDGNLWFTEVRTGKIGRITPSGQVSEFLIPSGASPGQITPGPDGHLWFTESTGIGRIATDGAIVEFPVTTRTGLAGIAFGADGNLWVTEEEGPIRRVTPSGVISEFSIDTITYGCRCSIAAGPDGNLWFTDPATLNGGFVGRITPTGVVTEFLVSTSRGSDVQGIAAGPDGNLWVADFGNTIWRITTAGDLTPFRAEGLSGPFAITTGPDGNLWFTAGGHEYRGVPLDGPGMVGSITPEGLISMFPLTPDSGPGGITAGPDGNVWFAEFNTNVIGRISPPSESN